jgi:hypothetical protein
MDRACSTHEKLNAYRVLVGNPEGSRQMRRRRRRCEDSIKMYVVDIERLHGIVLN